MTAEPKPNRTPTRTFRVDDELWQAATAKAANERRTVTDVIRAALVEFVREPKSRRT